MFDVSNTDFAQRKSIATAVSNVRTEAYFICDIMPSAQARFQRIVKKFLATR